MAVQRQKGTQIQGRQGATYDVDGSKGEGSSQSFKRGEFLVLSGGQWIACVDDAVLIGGYALAPASGVQGAPIDVAVPRSGCRFISSVFHSTPASAITAIAQPENRYGLQVDSNKHYIDIEDTSNLAFLATKIILPAGHAVGDQYGLLEFEILHEVMQLSGRDNA